MCIKADGSETGEYYSVKTGWPSKRLAIQCMRIIHLPGGIATYEPIAPVINISEITASGINIAVPKDVNDKYTCLETYKLYDPKDPNCLHPAWPSKVYTIKRGIWGEKHRVDIVDHLPKKLVKGRSLVYRGVRSTQSFFHDLSNEPRPIWEPTNKHEFGPALYYTSDPDLAKSYAQRGGLLFVHDFTDEGGRLTKKIFSTGDPESTMEWAQFVKHQVCEGTPHHTLTSKQYWEDFIIGPTSLNNSVVSTCAWPNPGSQQIAAKTQSAAEYMAAKIIAVVYVE